MTGLRIARASNALDKAVTARPASALGSTQQRCAATPQQVWRVLAPLIAARPTMRLWTPENGSARAGFHHVRPLRTRLPDAPAAVPIYVRGRTRVLVFDLDAKHLGPGAVAADANRILHWLNECSARAVVDTSASGGIHLLVPLTVAVSADQARPLLELAAAHCPTLDQTPMLNTATGCITVPGSVCREGGHRILAGTLEAATATFFVPNDTSVVEDLVTLIGATTHPTPHINSTAPIDPTLFPFGPDERLAQPFQRTTPPTPAVAAFAATGAIPTDGRWRSRSEARMSVLVHAIWRGQSLNDIRRFIRPGGPWATGLGAAYHRYRQQADNALTRDFHTAQRWISTHHTNFRAVAHKIKPTGGEAGGPLHHVWLAHAVWWCDTVFRSQPHRWTVAAVLQALAVAAARAGETIRDVPVVAVGGRSLSIGAGLVSESSVWEVLRRLRDMPGSPILLVARGRGIEADKYALVTPDVKDPDPASPGRPKVIEVHDAWCVIGLRHRRVYEVLIETGAQKVPEIAAVARVSLTSAYESVAELARIGLIIRSHGTIHPGVVTLDDIAVRHCTKQSRAQRLSAHRAARQRWRSWLHQRPLAVAEPTFAVEAPPPPQICRTWMPETPIELEYLESVLSTGPPTEVTT